MLIDIYFDIICRLRFFRYFSGLWIFELRFVEAFFNWTALGWNGVAEFRNDCFQIQMDFRLLF